MGVYPVTHLIISIMKSTKATSLRIGKVTSPPTPKKKMEEVVRSQLEREKIEESKFEGT